MLGPSEAALQKYLLASSHSIHLQLPLCTQEGGEAQGDRSLGPGDQEQALGSGGRSPLSSPINTSSEKLGPEGLGQEMRALYSGYGRRGL